MISPLETPDGLGRGSHDDSGDEFARHRSGRIEQALGIKLSSQDLARLYNLDDLIDGVAVPLPVRASQQNDHS